MPNAPKEYLFPKDTSWYIPRIGQRIVKTAVAVFICLAISALRGFAGGTMPTESAITAIICMQQNMHGTGRFAFNRFSGTLIGIAWGFLFLTTVLTWPVLAQEPLSLYALMAVGVLLCLYTTVLFHVTAASSLAAIVFLCIVISFPDIERPYYAAFLRVMDVLIGTTVAIVVNVFRLPRKKNPGHVFFIHSKDLVPDRFAQISPSVLFRLNYLYDEGAKICLISEHAPAFFTGQMWSAKLNVPLIVMDGAAIYDAENNRYLWNAGIPAHASAALREGMDDLGISYFIYTIHHNKTCIFHHGPIHDDEKTVYDRMQRSPYRDYLEGEVYDPSEIVYFKIIGDEGAITRVEDALLPLLSRETFRIRRRHQAGTKDIAGLYIYSALSGVEQAKKRIMGMLWMREANTRLVPAEYRLRTGYRSERDALRILQRVQREYEPLWILQMIGFSGDEPDIIREL